MITCSPGCYDGLCPAETGTRLTPHRPPIKGHYLSNPDIATSISYISLAITVCHKTTLQSPNTSRCLEPTHN